MVVGSIICSNILFYIWYSQRTGWMGKFISYYLINCWNWGECCVGCGMLLHTATVCILKTRDFNRIQVIRYNQRKWVLSHITLGWIRLTSHSGLDSSHITLWVGFSEARALIVLNSGYTAIVWIFSKLSKSVIRSWQTCVIQMYFFRQTDPNLD